MVVGPPQGGARGPLYFPEAFYALKDRILHRYGRPKGYALQHWTSFAFDYGDYDGGIKDGCDHYHILERTRLRGFTFHKPTGHFYWCNQVSEDYKRTVGFDEMKAKCVERMEGKKRITRDVPDRAEAFHALKHLWRRYRRLPEAPKAERPRVHAGNYYGEAMARSIQRDREKQAARQTHCHWCLEPKTGLEVTKHAGHEFCMKCLPKVLPS